MAARYPYPDITTMSALQIQKMQMQAELDSVKAYGLQIKDLREKLSRSREQMAKITDAIQRDLALIRSKCKDCDCPKDVPGTDCPNLTMHKTMTAIVHIALENMGE